MAVRAADTWLASICRISARGALNADFAVQKIASRAQQLSGGAGGTIRAGGALDLDRGVGTIRTNLALCCDASTSRAVLAQGTLDLARGVGTIASSSA